MATGSRWSRILANRISAIEGIDGTADASTTVDVSSASGQTVLSVASTTSFTAGQMVIIDDGNDNEEVAEISSISAGVSLTLETNLEYTHAIGVSVKQGWYHNTVAGSRSWDLMWIMRGFEEAGVVGGVQTVSEERLGVSTGHISWRRILVVGLRKPVSYISPLDQENDTEYQELLHDLIRAWMTDHTCGSLAHGTRIMGHRPATISDFVSLEEAGEEERELPYVGIIATVEIDYDTQTTDIYH